MKTRDVLRTTREFVRLDVALETDVPEGQDTNDAYVDADETLRDELQRQVDNWDIKNFKVK